MRPPPRIRSLRHLPHHSRLRGALLGGPFWDPLGISAANIGACFRGGICHNWLALDSLRAPQQGATLRMRFLTRAVTPTRNRRLNALVGLLLFASAVLLFLALVSYSPLDPSLNTAASASASAPARNWF